jgi:diacylglycerol kinase (ATP)
MSHQQKERVDSPAKHMARLGAAFGYSLQGLKAAYQEEAAIRLEAWAMMVLLPLALWAPVGTSSKAAMIMSALLVPIIELINSALEAVVDRIGSERHELSGRAKDMGSAAVLIAALGAAMVWAVCLAPWARSWM